MTQRFTAALATILICTGLSLAQETPEKIAAPAQPTLSESIGLTSFLPSEGKGRQTWVSADYLFTFVRGMQLPPLATTSDPGTARINAGVIGATGSRTLFGDGMVNDGFRSGLRLGAGIWFNGEQTLGIDAGFMIVEGQSTYFSGSSNAFPILARPITNALTGNAGAILVAFPGTSTGSLDIRASSTNFYEAHIDLTEKALDAGWYRLYSLLGYRYYRYDESLRVRQVLNPTDPNFIPGTQVITTDNFFTRNEFHGLDLGFRSQFLWDRLTVDVLTKVAVGRVNRVVNIGGEQTVSSPPFAPQTAAGGVLATQTNSSLLGSGDWKVMPEAGIAVSWQAWSNVSIRLGYSFILLNGVARAGDKVDTTVNPNFLPGGNPALGRESPHGDQHPLGDVGSIAPRRRAVDVLIHYRLAPTGELTSDCPGGSQNTKYEERRAKYE